MGIYLNLSESLVSNGCHAQGKCNGRTVLGTTSKPYTPPRLGGFSKLGRGGGPHNQDYRILGSILRSAIQGNYNFPNISTDSPHAPCVGIVGDSYGYLGGLGMPLTCIHRAVVKRVRSYSPPKAIYQKRASALF